MPPGHGPGTGAPQQPGGPHLARHGHPGMPQQTPQPPVPPSPAAPPGAPAPGGWGNHPSGPAAPPQDHTGHLRLPPGDPVEVPVHAAQPAAPDVAHTAVAVLLIGPAGAGKTTVARYWADRRQVPTAHISLDDVREWVRSGFADPQSGWNDQSEAQYRLARRTCGFAARNFLANGISCILDDAVFPDRPVVGLGGWKRHVGPGLLPIVLLPGLEIVLERNAERSGNRRLSDEEVARIHGRMAGWYGSGLPIIDNSRKDVETTARLLDEAVARSLASPPSW
ncbi:AAA family ATPase [Streptomyces durbertensis]|uniref:AAA family ATPase n=1 Tax=Streptomyces durbertensis TaxID=2448886 RepID=A0ABR6EMC8_9ACTN|nr:AAA family ATPase [Streptomyces durbertensis]MBB1246486.1 AAA family ATPase [Streptomyces durbertensis]